MKEREREAIILYFSCVWRCSFVYVIKLARPRHLIDHLIYSWTSNSCLLAWTFHYSVGLPLDKRTAANFLSNLSWSSQDNGIHMYAFRAYFFNTSRKTTYINVKCVLQCIYTGKNTKVLWLNSKNCLSIYCFQKS